MKKKEDEEEEMKKRVKSGRRGGDEEEEEEMKKRRGWRRGGREEEEEELKKRRKTTRRRGEEEEEEEERLYSQKLCAERSGLSQWSPIYCHWPAQCSNRSFRPSVWCPGKQWCYCYHMLVVLYVVVLVRWREYATINMMSWQRVTLLLIWLLYNGSLVRDTVDENMSPSIWYPGKQWRYYYYDYCTWYSWREYVTINMISWQTVTLLLSLLHTGSLAHDTYSYRILTRICHHQYDVLANNDVIIIIVMYW